MASVRRLVSTSKALRKNERPTPSQADSSTALDHKRNEKINCNHELTGALFVHNHGRRHIGVFPAMLNSPGGTTGRLPRSSPSASSKPSRIKMSASRNM